MKTKRKKRDKADAEARVKVFLSFSLLLLSFLNGAVSPVFPFLTFFDHMIYCLSIFALFFGIYFEKQLYIQRRPVIFVVLGRLDYLTFYSFASNFFRNHQLMSKLSS